MTESARLARIAARLSYIEQEGKMPAYLTLYRWMKDNGYHFTNPPRHVHLQRAKDMDPNYYVTEVQFPVGKSEV